MKTYLSNLISCFLIIFVHTSAFSGVPRQGLVAQYTFTGSAADSSKNGFNGTVAGATLTADRFGMATSAYSFNGSSSMIRCGDILDSVFAAQVAKFSISGWAKTRTYGTVSGGGGFIIGKNSGGGVHGPAQWNVTHLDGVLYGAVFSDTLAQNFVALTSPMTKGQWFHFVLIFDGSLTEMQRVKLYVNAVSSNASVYQHVGTLGTGTQASQQYLTIGASHPGGNPLVPENAYDGDVDDICIYNRVLSDQEIQDIYHDGGWPQALEPGLVAFYPFNGNANDSSGYGQNGTVAGATLTADRFGLSNRAYSFNGTSSIIRCGDILDTVFSAQVARFSVSGWAKTKSYKTLQEDGGYMFGKNAGGPGPYQWGLGHYQGLVLASIFSDTNGLTNYVGVVSPMTANQWFHFVYVFDGSQPELQRLKLYINGQSSNSSVLWHVGAIGTTTVNTRQQFTFGATHARNFPQVNSNFYDGTLDDIRIYNKVLSDQEIQVLYHEGGWSPLGGPPVVTSFTPLSGPIGTLVTITGTNFNPIPMQNIVYFGGAKAAVTNASPTSLTVVVPMGATIAPITVTDTASRRTACSNSLFSVSFTGGSTIDTSAYPNKFSFAGPRNPGEPLAADLDGDGRIDLVIGNDLTSATPLSILRNTTKSGVISFAPAIPLAAGNQPRSLATGDLNADGKLDIIATNTAGTTVSLFLNTSGSGSLSFSSKIDLAGGSGPDGSTVGDIDCDGLQDVIFTNLNVGTITIYRNTSNSSTVSFAPRMDITVGSRPYRTIVNDLDLDGLPDLASVDAITNSIHILRNTSVPGAISFATKFDISSGKGPYRLAVADFDKDGKNDLVALDQNDSAFSLFRNTSIPGSIAFASRVVLHLGRAFAQQFIVADINGDSKPDLTFMRMDTSSVSLFQNQSSLGSFAFGNRIDFKRTSSTNSSLAVADLDGIGAPEIVATNYPDSSFVVLKAFAPELTIDIPKIVSIRDVPNDNGKQVIVTWKVAHPAAANGISKFSIRYWDKASLNWVIVRGDLNAYVDTIHASIVTTIYDSTKTKGMYYSVFQVAAHGVSPEIVTISPSDSGYSVDNLPPLAPTSPSARTVGGAAWIVSWKPASGQLGDFKNYVIYRSTTQNFVLDSTTRLGAVMDTVYLDNVVQAGMTYYYGITSIDYSGNESQPLTIRVGAMSVEQLQEGIPKDFELSENYPNPFNPSTTIRFGVPVRSQVTIEIYNVLGQLMTRLVNEDVEPGYYQKEWVAGASSGIYLCRIEAFASSDPNRRFVAAKKMLLLK